MQIKAIELINFMGFSYQNISFDGNGFVVANNGVGKTTLATAYYWVFANKNYELMDNPPIRPIGVEDCEPRVNLTVEIDGTDYYISKYQKQKVTEDKGTSKTKIALTNFYEVNDVPKSEKDFKEYFVQRGIDFNNFLELSHPDVFTSNFSEKKQREHMRSILTGMVAEITDLDIARSDERTLEVAQLLEKYSSEEIRAMHEASKRKIYEVYGVDGKLWQGKIVAKEETKQIIDVAELELQKNALNEQLAENKAKQSDFKKTIEKSQKLSREILEMEKELSELVLSATKEISDKKNSIRMEISNIQADISTNDMKLKKCEMDYRNIRQTIDRLTNDIDKYREQWNEENNCIFDENSLVCPYCEQEYPEDKKERLRAEFESHKAKLLNEVTEKGNTCKTEIDNAKAELDMIEAQKNAIANISSELSVQLEEKKAELENIPTLSPSDVPGYSELSVQLEEKKAELENNSNINNSELVSEEKRIISELIEVERKFAIADNNNRIDDVIAEMKEQAKKYEDELAHIKSITDQLDRVSRKKNELIVEDVNSHFDLVKWVLFDYQKNGEYKEVCIPTIDKKRYEESMNTGLEVLAKLDIVNGLQRFYNKNYPVFLDKAERLSGNTLDRININSQLICLNVWWGKDTEKGNRLMIMKRRFRDE